MGSSRDEHEESAFAPIAIGILHDEEHPHLGDCLDSVEREARAGDEIHVLALREDHSLAQATKERPEVTFHDLEGVSLRHGLRTFLRAVHHDWVYLLPSSCALTSSTLPRFPRAPHEAIHGLTSWTRCMEPVTTLGFTGWLTLEVHAGELRPRRRSPRGGDSFHGTLCDTRTPGLYRRASLLETLAACTSQDPEPHWDLEPSLLAWRRGHDTLFDPSSIVRRFETPWLPSRTRAPQAFFEFLEAFSTRAGSKGDTASLPCLERHRVPRTFTRATARKPRLLLVVPFAIHPPTHGGAVRIAHLVDALRPDWEIHLLTDEATAYDDVDTSHERAFASIHFVTGRPNDPEGPPSRAERRRRHAHLVLRAELRRLVRGLDPDVVQIEHAELAELIDERDEERTWILDLHDVYVGSDGREEDDEREIALARAFDARLVCSGEDADLLRGTPCWLVPNGVSTSSIPQAPSPDGPKLLFAGPFRYAPNWEGIRAFLRSVYPHLLEAFPRAELVILGGDGAPELVRDLPEFRRSGVQVRPRELDVRSLVLASTLTINPMEAIRGSSLKVLESLAWGRVCVTTEAGARGFREAGFPGLIVAPRIEAMLEPLLELCADSARRHALERPSPSHLGPFTWESIGASLRRRYEAFVRRTPESSVRTREERASPDVPPVSPARGEGGDRPGTARS